jgi:enoyl-CoA hydratase/carnithine racemase
LVCDSRSRLQHPQYLHAVPSTDAVQYQARGAIGVLTLNRPDNRNSMTPELLDAFAAASAAARNDARIRCLIVTGTGTCFSSGADFKATLQREGGEPHERSYAMYAPFLSLLDIEVPIVGALNGHAVGGGFGLALLCDLRVGNLDSKYGANFVRLGLAPGMAISYMLPRIVGLAHANEMLLTATLISGAEAKQIGLLDRAVPATEVMPIAEELAERIASNAPFAVRATKAAIRRGLALEIRDAARAEAVSQAQSIVMDDAREGITALLDKRDPFFTGR